MEYERTREVLTAFEQHGVRYAIIGAVALSLLGLARADAERLRLHFEFEED